MSRQAVREVEFYTEGKLVKTVTDAKTAQAIGMYKDIYNKVQYFQVTLHKLTPRRIGFVREVIVAESHRLKIYCTKEYLPDVPEVLSGVQYDCGILNKKTEKIEQVGGGVPLLYYKLFREHVK